MSYVYIKSERAGHQSAEHDLFTVGFYEPDGKWQPDSDHMDENKAAERVHYLNGGKVTVASEKRDTNTPSESGAGSVASRHAEGKAHRKPVPSPTDKKCGICNQTHSSRADAFAEHISAWGGVEAWSMWRDFARELCGEIDALNACRSAEPATNPFAPRLKEITAGVAPMTGCIGDVRNAPVSSVRRADPLDVELAQIIERGMRGKDDPCTIALFHNQWEAICEALRAPASATSPSNDADNTRILELHSDLHHALQNTDEAIEQFENFAEQVLGWCGEAVAHFAQSTDNAEAEHRWSERSRLVRKLLEPPADETTSATEGATK